jgi:hypothetical protein
MIPGFNHNIVHRGNVYHVQTEDLGLQNPLVSTHLFLGGNVLATRRTSYAEIARHADADARIRKLMQDQHKEMLRQLIRGAFDREGAAAEGLAYQPGEIAGVAPAPRAAKASASPPAAPPRAAPPADEPPVLSRRAQAQAQARAPILIPEIEDEDLLSDRRLDEVILAYLADAPGMKHG